MSDSTYTKAQYEKDCLERNEAFKKKHGREIHWTDIVKSFGGTLEGCSMVNPNFRSRRIAQDDGVL